MVPPKFVKLYILHCVLFRFLALIINIYILHVYLNLEIYNNKIKNKLEKNCVIKCDFKWLTEKHCYENSVYS